MSASKKKLGLGSISVLLFVIGMVWSWSFSLGGFCIGDVILNAIGLQAWSQQGNMRIHFTVYYSLLFFIAAFVLGYHYKNDFGAKTGKTASLVMGLLIMISVFYIVT